jgi:hypothetical protein
MYASIQEEHMPALARTFAVGTTAAALVLLAACGSDSGAAGKDGGSPEITITSPSDRGNVGRTFEVKWDSNVELGETDTGRDHVHVFVDGHSNDYTVVGGNEFTVKGLSPGKHTVNVTLQHADHSSAGAEDEVDVNVGASGGTSETTPPEDTGTHSRYGY